MDERNADEPRMLSEPELRWLTSRCDVAVAVACEQVVFAGQIHPEVGPLMTEIVARTGASGVITTLAYLSMCGASLLPPELVPVSLVERRRDPRRGTLRIEHVMGIGQPEDLYELPMQARHLFELVDAVRRNDWQALAHVVSEIATLAPDEMPGLVDNLLRIAVCVQAMRDDAAQIPGAEDAAS